MIVDSSALVAIAFDEPLSKNLVVALNGATEVRMSSATWLESLMVLSGAQVIDACDIVAGLIDEFGIELIPFSEAHAVIAVATWQKFGKGNHPARLNFGDCMTYATAKLAGEPLLFVGSDFALTDIESVL